MTTSTLALSDFLLARIAEDEASDGWHTVDCGLGLGYWATEVCVCGYPARVLAECEAKRRIVEEVGGYAKTYAWHGEGVIRLSAEGARAAEVLRLLALPYAAHPDFNPEWAP